MVDNKIYNFVLILLSITGFFMIWISSHWGIGVSPDSIQYIKGARGLVTGKGVFNLSPHWPPGYPIALYLLSFLFDDIVYTARVFQALIFSINIWLFSRLTNQGSTSAQLVSISAAFFILTSVEAYSIHFMAWTEGVFISLQLLSLYFLSQYYLTNKVVGLLISALFAAIALGFRYAGIAFIGTACISILLFSSNTSFKRRFFYCGLYGLISVSTFVIWGVGNKIVHGSTANREFVFHLIPYEKIINFPKLIIFWFGRDGAEIHTCIIILIIFIAVIIKLYKWYTGKDNDDDFLQRFSLLYCILYTFFIFISITFIDAYIPIDQRIFFPVYIFFFLFLFRIARCYYLNNINIIYKTIISIIIGYLCFYNLFFLDKKIKSNIDHGSFILSEYWFRLPILNYLKTHNFNQVNIYSNAMDALYLHLNINGEILPYKYNPTTLKNNKLFNSEVMFLVSEYKKGNAMIIWLYATNYRTYLISLDSLTNSITNNPIYNGPDGVIFYKKNM